MAVTKSELIESLSASEKLPKAKAELIVNLVFDAMADALKQGERIEIRGFGSFEVRSYKAYEGRNPRTGVQVNVKPKRLPFFKVGKDLRERVNAGAGSAAASDGPTPTAGSGAPGAATPVPAPARPERKDSAPGP
jgi:integration host factor subunit beta